MLLSEVPIQYCLLRFGKEDYYLLSASGKWTSGFFLSSWNLTCLAKPPASRGRGGSLFHRIN